MKKITFTRFSTLLVLLFLFFGISESYGQVFTKDPGSSVLNASGISTNGKVTVEYVWFATDGSLLVAYSMVNPGGSKTAIEASYTGFAASTITTTVFTGPFTDNLVIIGTTINLPPLTSTGAWLVADFGLVSLSDPFVIGLDINANGFDVEGLSVTIDDYTVTYNANGGVGVVNDPSNPYLENATVTILSNAFTRVGYTFTGWNTAANGSGTTYQSGNTFSMPAADVVLYAQWTLSCTDPVITNPGPQTACDSFDLDALPITGTNINTPKYYNNSQANSGTEISGLITSTQTVWIYDEDGACSDEESFSITINALDDASFSYSGSPYCADGTDPTPTVTGVSGGSFSSTAGLSINSTTGVIDLSASTAGTYTVTYSTGSSNSSVCANSSTDSVTINALDDASFSYSGSPYCADGTDPTPTVTGVSGGSFSSTAGLSINSTTGVIDLSASTAGTYTVTYSTGSSNSSVCANSSKDSVTINALPVVNAGPSKTITCSNDTVVLNGSSNSQDVTYAWTTQNGVIDSGANTLTPTVSESGTYTLTITDKDTGCSNSSSVVVTKDIAKPDAIILLETTILTCETTSIELDGSTSTSNATYIWNTGERTKKITVTEPGNYWLEVSYERNGCAKYAFITITEDKEKSVVTITGDSELNCTNTSITLDASGSTVQGTASYLWSTGATTATIAVTEPGDYDVTVTDSDNGCSTTSGVFTVTQDITEVVAAISGDSELNCTTTSITLDASGSTVQGTASYLWSTGATTATIAVTEPGDYDVTVTDSDNGCSATSEVFTVAQDITEVVATISGDSELNCTATSITLDASGSTVQGTASYLWSTGATTATIAVTEPGDYDVTVTDSDNGCSTISEAFTVTQDITEVVATISGDSELNCTTTSITLNASGSTVQGTASYLWSTGATTATIAVTEPGDYDVTVTDSDNGCSTLSETFTITQDITEVVATITGDSSELTCIVGSIVLDASSSTVQGNASYAWYNDGELIEGAMNSTLSVSEVGNYTVLVTDSDNGCSMLSEVFAVTEDGTMVVATITEDATELNCSTTSVVLDASSSTVQGTASYLWNTGATTATLEVTEPGNYSVTVTDSDNGCSTLSEIFTVTEDVTSVIATISGSSEINCSGSIILDASNSTIQGTASYLWNTGATSATIEISEAGDYSVTVTDSDNGCSDESDLFTVIVVDTGVTVVANICDDLNDVNFGELYSIDLNEYLGIEANSAGVWESIDGESVNGSIFELIKDNSGRTYEFEYTDENGCVSTLALQTCAVLPCSTEELTISKVVTPNNDSYNDTFEIGGLEGCGFNFHVQVFNRWGKMVFESENYLNNWSGYSNTGGSTIGSSTSLPAGTYYYIVRVLDSGFDPVTGYIYLGSR